MPCTDMNRIWHIYMYVGEPGKPGKNTWLLIELTPNGVNFSFLFFLKVGEDAEGHCRGGGPLQAPSEGDA